MNSLNGRKYSNNEEVDFVIIGSGAAGGVIAKELSTNGFKVVVLEQGPFRQKHEFNHDELSVMYGNELMGGINRDYPQTFRQTNDRNASIQITPPPALYSKGVGGSSVHFSGNYWRFHPIDFKERSLLGEIKGTGFDDWPISYEELEPYYTKVDWEIGVSGEQGPFDPPRSKAYPMPPVPIKSSGVILSRGAKKLGLHPQAAPLAILSQPFNNRAPCIHCGFCMAFGCEVGAKSSVLETMIPQALKSGNCEIRPNSTVFNIPTNKKGRIEEVLYWDAKGKEQRQKTKAVILSANGAETPRLLLMSESSLHSNGLANSSGLVGKYLMFNGHSVTKATFDEPLNEYKSVQCTSIIHDFYDSDPKRGFYGGGGIDGRPFLSSFPMNFALDGLPPNVPKWGAEYKKRLMNDFTRNMVLFGNTTSLAVETNNVTLDPKIKDKHGSPALRITYQDHPDDLSMAKFLQDKCVEIFHATEAKEVWTDPVESQNVGAHLLGTCRMGNDPEKSVVDKNHRSHDVANLFICDGSSFVTSGRGQPTMTIQALAFRASDKITDFAKKNLI